MTLRHGSFLRRTRRCSEWLSTIYRWYGRHWWSHRGRNHDRWPRCKLKEYPSRSTEHTPWAYLESWRYSSSEAHPMHACRCDIVLRDGSPWKSYQRSGSAFSDLATREAEGWASVRYERLELMWPCSSLYPDRIAKCWNWCRQLCLDARYALQWIQWSCSDWASSLYDDLDFSQSRASSQSHHFPSSFSLEVSLVLIVRIPSAIHGSK